jgi:signal transduction histidine kinase
VEVLRALTLFDGLTDAQLADLVEAGTEVGIEPGVDLFHEGEHADFWWVLLDGVVNLVRHIGREDVVVATMEKPGLWAGGFRAWDAEGVYLATGRGAARGRVLRVPAEALRDRIGSWFPFAQHLLRGLYTTARSIESTARQRESLVALGGLAADLAHEINNPAAAAARAVADLEDVCETLLSSPELLARGEVTPPEFAALDALRRQIHPQAVRMTPLALADHEETLSDWLTDHDVDESWKIAPGLAAAGVDIQWCERAASALPGRALQAGLGWIVSAVSMAGLLADVKDSTRRISELVAAVRSYSQMDRASMQHIDVTDGLENTLVMVGHRLGTGVRIHRDYGTDVPRIDAYAGELNQVWTHLMVNAAEAMKGSGVLRVSTRAEGDEVVVEIGDTGPGMPPEVAARAFEAFYTTKTAGEGAGLGLDIGRRIIVERHGGAIDIDSDASGTLLRVRLPQVPHPGRRITGVDGER